MPAAGLPARLVLHGHAGGLHRRHPWRQHLTPTCRGTTNHIERFNATLRARIGQLVRKSLYFSRSLKILNAYLHLFLHNYNLTRQPT
ncbi:IS1 family transposase [Hymenobacter sp. 15J16-1T3B]|uniref:IS1 family transposase n=1 Tax=Hymenobacter sp. 15J16-1T3B TaxID=2886941 RepID=UPI001D109565|nr:IS1 family transposase [Hymenobacter sp. 15J16-1T3B]MCC3158659.1 IS1 family transposase [Hymenobacter sp. 15J16-1T3B]